MQHRCLFSGLKNMSTGTHHLALSNAERWSLTMPRDKRQRHQPGSYSIHMKYNITHLKYEWNIHDRKRQQMTKISGCIMHRFLKVIALYEHQQCSRNNGHPNQESFIRNQESFISSKQHRHNIDNNIGISMWMFKYQLKSYSISRQ